MIHCNMVSIFAEEISQLIVAISSSVVCRVTKNSPRF